MKVIVPITVDSSNLASNVPEDDATEWTAGTYSTGDVRMHNHRVWESLVNSNTAEPGTDASKWLDTGATNRYKMFDEFVNSQTAIADEIDVTISTTDIIGGLALYQLDASEVVITLTDSAEGVVYQKTIDLLDIAVIDYDEYFFYPINMQSDAHVTDMNLVDFPFYLGMDVRIQVRNTGSTAKCGRVVLGQMFGLGNTKWGPRIGIISFSKKIRDEFGRIYALPGKSSKRASVDLHVPNGVVDFVQRRLAEIDGVACSFIGDTSDTGFQSLNILGFFRDFEITIPGPAMSSCTIELEGLI